MGERNRMTDEKLIRQYVREGSEDAFRQIVERYLKVVYATCLREVHNPEMAQDVTQIVFVLLAQKARRLRRGTVLSGWLYTTARFTSRVALRNETRRRHYEMRAVEQMPNYEDREEHSAAGEVIEPWLNEALSRLAPKDREVLLMRYAEEHSMREIGERCGISEHGAHMRVTRALEKLRRGLKMRGIDAPESTALAIALPLLLTGSSLTVPSSVSAAAISHAVSSILAGTASAAVTGARLLQLSQGVQQAMRLQQMKIAGIVLAACLGVGFGTGKITHSIALAATRANISPKTVLEVAATGGVRYTVTDLGTLPGFTNVVARSINNKGEIVGGAGLGDGEVWHSFYYHEGMMRDLGAPDGFARGVADHINDTGTIVGYAANRGDSVKHSIIGTKDRLSLYIPPAPFKSTSIQGINNDGVIVGQYSEGVGYESPTTGFLLSNGKIQTISASSGTLSLASGINDSGEVIGRLRTVNSPGRTLEQACVYSAGKITVLPNLAGCDYSFAMGINRSGNIAGQCFDHRGSLYDRAFLYRNGFMTNLGTTPGYTASAGMGINSADVVVGYIGKQSPLGSHAALFKDGHAFDLNTLIDPAAGWELAEARGINDQGQIVGLGLHNGARRAFLLTPKS